jgi:hypothetical protein
MYGRMTFKGIWLVATALLASVPAAALEEKFVLSLGATPAPAGALAPAGARVIGDWDASGAEARTGYKGGKDFVLVQAAYSLEPGVDLLFHFDAEDAVEETGAWEVQAERGYLVDPSRARMGSGAGSFRGADSGLAFAPREGALLARDSRIRDFSLEFWLYSANAENGEVILLWQSIRKMPGGVLPQQLSCVIAGGRLLWSFVNFFSPPEATKPDAASNRVELGARGPLVPREWSHHLLRFDSDTGLVEYLVDGLPEAVAYATSSGGEGGTVRWPVVGAASPLRFCPTYSGLADELRISRRFVEKPNLSPYGRGGAVVVSPIADLGFGHSRLNGIDAVFKAPGTSGLEFSYRIGEDWASWRRAAPPWTPFRAGEAFPDPPFGRFVQIRVELFPDGTGTISPALSSLALRFEPDRPPPPPARLSALPRDSSVELRWTRVPEADLAGYLVYYGEAPGEYFGRGADQGPSPVDAGNTTTLTITGLPNGKLLYFAVAAYDGAAGSSAGGAPSRAGAFSQETAARPSRTAR